MITNPWSTYNTGLGVLKSKCLHTIESVDGNGTANEILCKNSFTGIENTLKYFLSPSSMNPHLVVAGITHTHTHTHTLVNLQQVHSNVYTLNGN